MDDEMLQPPDGDNMQIVMHLGAAALPDPAHAELIQCALGTGAFHNSAAAAHGRHAYIVANKGN